MKKFLLISLVLVLVESTHTFAQDSKSVFPNVKKITLKGNALPIQSIKIKDNSWINLINRTPVGNLIQKKNVKNTWTLDIDIKNASIAKKNTRKTTANGTYYLKIDDNNITLVSNDSTGVFYGLQTLHQLIQDQKINRVEILDYPSVNYRGVVEGFYGTPWSLDDRISQLKFYGTIKANTYIYGPKDDPYHSSPNWRLPYPEKEALQIKKLVNVAKENFVDFVWAIHPGKDIKWTKEDQNNVIKKFEMMYALGIRSFAVFFDDISGQGTDANKQAQLLNLINKNFVQVKKDVKPLMMCPTEYNKSWANPKPNSYLSILGENLDPSIQIMWTGDKVVDDITKSSLKWVQERIKRPVLVWWNFPVSDYTRSHLLLGASYGLENGIDASQMAGILSNPMEHAESSKVAVFGLADYAWNTAAYAPYKAWIAGIKSLIPDATEAYTLFSENNADPGKNGHRYRRKESESVKPYFDRLNKTLHNHSADIKDLDFVADYFQKINTSSEKIQQSTSNPALITEIKPWLEDFSKLGKVGTTEIQNYRNVVAENENQFWNSFVTSLKNTPGFESSTDKNKIIPTTGTLVLKPFVDMLKTLNNQLFFEKITGQKNTVTKLNATGTISTQIPALQNLRLLQENEDKIVLQPILEVFEMKTNDALIIHLNRSLKNAEIKVVLDNEDLNWALLEVSKDGEKWVSPSRYDENKSITSTIEDDDFTFVKFENIGLEPIKTKMNKFIIKYEPDQTEETQNTLNDFNIYTAYTINPQKNLTISNPNPAAKSVTLLTDAANSPLQIKIQNEAGAWKTVSPTSHENIVKIQFDEKISSMQIIPEKVIQVFEAIWK